MKTIQIQGKDYIPVNERIKEFRKQHPTFSLVTELVEVNEKHALIKASVLDDQGRILAQGTAFETAGSSFINKVSHVENAETSAWGRALGNLGIGIDASIASADEVATAVLNQNKPVQIKPTVKAPVKKQPTVAEAMEHLTACGTRAQLKMIYDRLMIYEWSEDGKKDLLECFRNVDSRLSQS